MTMTLAAMIVSSFEAFICRHPARPGRISPSAPWARKATRPKTVATYRKPGRPKSPGTHGVALGFHTVINT
jgi:hypothetical protein